MFYINYEECKLTYQYDEGRQAVGFILTMRNVNTTAVIVLGRITLVLY